MRGQAGCAERVRRCRIDGARGLRVAELEERELADLVGRHRAALAAADDRVLKDDGRTAVTAHPDRGGVIVKQGVRGGALRRTADVLRGSPGRRAWCGGHGLRARGIAAARPLALLERVRMGIPVASLVVLEDLRATGRSLEDLASQDDLGGDVLTAVADTLARLHEARADHGDLKASHVFLRPASADAALAVGLIDLEGVRFRRRIGDATRVAALAQLNASLPDSLGPAERLRAYRHYTARLPFRGGDSAALARIVAESLARADVWSGCAPGRGAELGVAADLKRAGRGADVRQPCR